MNNNIKSLIINIEKQFKIIYGRDLNEFKQVDTNDKDINHTLVSINNWTSDEIEFIIERALMGINYYAINFIPIDKTKNGFPIASYNSILNVLENNGKEILLYTKKIPELNRTMESFLKVKSWLK